MWIPQGCAAFAALGLLWVEWRIYRDRMNQIADDIQWHVEFRDRIQ